MSEVRIQILADLHLETPPAYDVFTIPPSAPHLALLGDIGNAKDSGLFDFLKAQLKAFKTVFFLLGNHEPYHMNWVQAKEKITKFKDVVIIPEQNDHVSFGLNDFHRIENWTTDQHNLAHASDLLWLNQQVATIAAAEPQRKIVILTHHSPCVDARAIDPAHVASKLSSGFVTDLCQEACWMSEKVKVWACGHTHFNFDLKQGEKRVLANQRGYYFKQAEGFEVGKIIEI